MATEDEKKTITALDRVAMAVATRSPLGAVVARDIIAERDAREAEREAEAAKKPPQRISEQNFLLRNLDLLAAERAKVKVERVIRMQTKEPGSLLNRLNLRPNVEELFKIRPHQIAALVPKIRLYKVFLDEVGTPDEIVELRFNDHTTPTSVEDITRTKYGRGDGVGIQSFTVETQGTNPAEGALVRCTLSIFFQNLEMLAAPSGNRENDYLELILRRTKFEKVLDSTAREVPLARVANKDYFKLLAVVGWAVPDGSLAGPDESDEDLRKALESCTQTIFLSLYEHKIDFNQDGTAVLTAEYQGALEQMLSSDSYDILSLAEEDPLSKRLRVEQKKLDDARKKGKKIEDSETKTDDPQLKAIRESIVRFKKQINELTAQARAKKYKTLIEKLYFSKKVGSIDVTPKEWEEIHKGGRGSLKKVVVGDVHMETSETLAGDLLDSAESAVGSEGRSATDKIVSWFNNAWASKDTESTRISFFYFGDLMDLAAELLEKRRADDKKTTPDIKILLGQVTFNVVDDLGTVTPKHVNLANVPISLKSFEFWFNKNVVKRKINTWPLRAFIKQAVSELILNALGENSKQDEGIRRSNQVGIQNLLIPGMGSSGDKKHRIQGNENGDFNLDDPSSAGLSAHNSFPIETPGQIGYSGYKHYLLVYGSTEILDRRNPADVSTDFADGIYHFNIGADAGLVKSINFTKTDVPSLKESRLTSQDEEEGQLRDKYNASLELIGSSPLFTPGQKIYVNPTLAGMGTITSRNSIARQLGLGGYYDVIKVLSTIDRSGYRTSLECVWTSFGKEVAEGASKTSPAAAATSTPADLGLPPAPALTDPISPPIEVKHPGALVVSGPLRPASRIDTTTTIEKVRDGLAKEKSRPPTAPSAPPPPPPVDDSPYFPNPAAARAETARIATEKARADAQARYDIEQEEATRQMLEEER